jgi:hypothetical protein
MTEQTDYLTFLLEMKTLAKEARSRRRRIRYSPDQQETAMGFLAWVEGRGCSFEEAAELLSMHRSTLQGWLLKAIAAPAYWGETPTPTVKIIVEVQGGIMDR